MKLRIFIALFGIAFLNSCGLKTPKSVANITEETNAYVSKINANTSLKEETTEGALTDAEGFKDIGQFKYTVYFDEQTKTLYKITNVETTTETVSETYYFKEGKLMVIDVNSAGSENRMYVRKGKFVTDNRDNADAEKLLLDKAKRFRKAFKRNH